MPTARFPTVGASTWTSFIMSGDGMGPAQWGPRWTSLKMSGAWGPVYREWAWLGQCKVGAGTPIPCYKQTDTTENIAFTTPLADGNNGWEYTMGKLFVRMSTKPSQSL